MRLRFNQPLETRLFEMAVIGKSRSNVVLAHKGKTYTVRNAPFLIGMATENPPALILQFSGYMHDFQARSILKTIEKFNRPCALRDAA